MDGRDSVWSSAWFDIGPDTCSIHRWIGPRAQLDVLVDGQQPGEQRGAGSTMLLYDVIAATLLLYSGIEGLVGNALWPAVFVHVALGGWCIVELRQRNWQAPSEVAQARQ
jgi:hypothetical protein